MKNQMSIEENKAKIKSYLSRFFRNYDLQDDDEIFRLGFVDSMFAMQLVLYIEKEFRITIENTDLDIDNFKTVNDIASFIARKTL